MDIYKESKWEVSHKSPQSKRLQATSSDHHQLLSYARLVSNQICDKGTTKAYTSDVPLHVCSSPFISEPSLAEEEITQDFPQKKESGQYSPPVVKERRMYPKSPPVG